MALTLPLTVLVKAQTLLNVELTGTQNRIVAGAELAVQSGATFTANGGSVIDLFHATVALPQSLALKDIKFDGSENELNDGSTLTLLSGSTFTAAAGSTLNLSAATITFPSSVVLTTGSQILTQKTFASPTLSGSVTLANGASIDLGTGPMSDPIADTIQPLRWGSGGRYMLNAGYTWFKSPAYPDGIIDHLGGLGYNVGAPPVSGDVQFGTFFESRFQNDPHGVDTEYYYAWNGPVGAPVESGGRNGRRIFQSNVSWGVTNYSGTRLMGSASWDFDLNLFSLRNGADAGHTLDVDMGVNDSDRSTHTWHWFGGEARFDGAFIIGGTTTVNGTGTHTFHGPLNVQAGSTWDNASNIDLAVTSDGGDGAISFRNSVNNYFRVGTGSSGTLFGGLTNNHALDSVAASAGLVRPTLFRYSSDTGSSFTNALSIDPENTRVRNHFTLDASSASNAAEVIDGGLAVGKRSWFGDQVIIDRGGAFMRFSADAVADNPGIWFRDGGSPTAANAALFGANTSTILNVASGGSVFVRIANGNYISVNATTGVTVDNAKVTISDTTISTSSTTGALVVAGGVGISGNLYSANYATTGTVTSKGSGNSSTSMDASNNGAALNLISDTIGNYRTIDFGYGPSPTVNWILGYNGYFPSTWIGLYNNVSGGAMMLDGNNNLYVGNNNTAMAGSYNLALEGGVIDTRTSAPIVLKQNGATALTIANSTLSATLASTTASTSTTTGALVVAGGLGLGGNAFLGGSLNLPGGGAVSGSSGGLSLAAAGANQNINLTPSGTGGVTTTASITAGGTLVTTATTPSTSTSTGALMVSGGAGIQKKVFLGDDLVLAPTASTAATVRLSGTAIANTPGIWFRDGGSPASTNVALSGSSSATTVNGPSGGAVTLGIGGSPYFVLNSSGANLVSVPLKVLTSVASASNTTGSATFAGGIGVSGRTSTASLSVGTTSNSTPVTGIFSTTTTLDFPSIAPLGGAQDLTVTVNGAVIGADVSIVESGATFLPAGVVMRAIVTASNTVTVRVTNCSGTPIDPAATNFRVTVTNF